MREARTYWWMRWAARAWTREFDGGCWSWIVRGMVWMAAVLFIWVAGAVLVGGLFL